MVMVVMPLLWWHALQGVLVEVHGVRPLRGQRGDRALHGARVRDGLQGRRTDTEQGEGRCCTVLCAWFPAWGGLYGKRKGQGGEGEDRLIGYNWNGQKDLWDGRLSAKFEEHMRPPFAEMGFTFRRVPIHRYHGLRATGSTSHHTQRHRANSQSAGAWGSAVAKRLTKIILPRLVSTRAASGHVVSPKQLQRGKQESVAGHHTGGRKVRNKWVRYRPSHQEINSTSL